MKWLVSTIAFIALLFFVVSITEGPAMAQRKKMTIEEAFTIKGEILRPQMAITMQRSKINYDALEPKKSFLDRVIRSASQDPF